MAKAAAVLGMTGPGRLHLCRDMERGPQHRLIGEACGCGAAEAGRGGGRAGPPPKKSPKEGWRGRRQTSRGSHVSAMGAAGLIRPKRPFAHYHHDHHHHQYSVVHTSIRSVKHAHPHGLVFVRPRVETSLRRPKGKPDLQRGADWQPE